MNCNKLDFSLDGQLSLHLLEERVDVVLRQMVEETA